MKKIVTTVGILGAVILGSTQLFGDSLCKPDDLKTSNISLVDKTTTQEMSQTVFSCGTFETGTTAIPDSANRMIVMMTREAWQENGDGINIIEIQTDFFDGKRWMANVGGFTTDGGDRFEKGQLALTSYNDTSIPSGTNRLIRIRVLSKINLSSHVSLKFYTE